MKNRLKYLMISIFMLVLFAFTCQSASASKEKPRHFENEIQNNSVQRTAVFPESLQIIGEEAFEGTAITAIVLPESVEFIGDYAFANIRLLKSIHIISNSVYIGNSVFNDSSEVTITSSPISCAQVWAKENNIPFIPALHYFIKAIQNQLTGLVQIGTERIEADLFSTTAEKKTPRPGGRMAAEIKADKYDGLMAYHLQGRAPPMKKV